MVALALTAFVYGQTATADIYGTVVLPDGSPIPGVTVTLTGTVGGTQTAVTSEEGNFRFLRLPPGEYDLKFELEGFKTVIRKGIRVFVGKNITLTVPMETSTIKEEVVVTAKPAVVDVRKTTVGVNVSKEAINSLPTARNPWTIISLVPGMMTDRVDVGGADSGQQSNFLTGGGSFADTTWNVDGANMTDPSAIGAAPAYLNVNAYEEIQVAVGANDITAQTGGVQINFVTKRAGNKFAGDFHLYVQDKAWELTRELTAYYKNNNLVNPGIERLYQYGINFGGPIVKDKLWFVGSYAIQDIHARTNKGNEDATWLVSSYLKLNFQLGNTSGDFHISYDAKKKWGRTVLSPAQQDNGSLFDQDGPGWVYYGGLSHVMGNLMLNAKVMYTDGGFVLDPRGSNINPENGHNEGNDWQFIYSPRYYFGSMYHYITNRNMINASVDANYFAEKVLGGNHEIRFGVDYVTADTTTQTLYPNQRVLFFYLYSNLWYYNEVWLCPDVNFDVNFQRISFYLADTVSFGKLTLNLGVRYDKEIGRLNRAVQKPFTWYEPGSPYHGRQLFPDRLGEMIVPEYKSPASWKLISPRISLTYDITGDGKNVAKLTLARYGSQGGNGLASNLFPYREIDALWVDLNKDKKVQLPELYYYGYIYETWNNTDAVDYTKGISKNQYDPNYNTPLLDELTVAFEKALGDDMAITISGSYKKNHNLSWTRGMFEGGVLETKDNWSKLGEFTWEGKTYEYYQGAHKPQYNYYTNAKKDYNKYMAINLIFTKKFANKWMADASFTYQDWKQVRFEEEAFNMNNFNYFNNGVVAPETSGSGLTGVYMNSRWLVKLSGLYQLPYGINFTAVFQAREGYVIPYSISYRYKLYADQSATTVAFYEPGKKFGDDRLPAFWMLNLGLEKTFKVSDTTSVTLFVDGYNVTNNGIDLKVDSSIGAVTNITGGAATVTPNATARQSQIINNVGNFQFGVRVNF